eukprot:2815300-Amphidinium_carterae.1
MHSDHGQKLGSIDGLLEPHWPDTFTSVSVVANNPVTTMVRVAAVTTRAISPHSVDTRLGNRSRFKGR